MKAIIIILFCLFFVACFEDPSDNNASDNNAGAGNIAVIVLDPNSSANNNPLPICTQSNYQDFISKAEPPRCELQYANLWGAQLLLMNLQGVNLQSADLQSANLRGANLQGAILKNVNLAFANLTDANLQGANLQRADLRGTNLQRADLQKADLRYAKNLETATLQEVNLVGAIVTATQGDILTAKGFADFNTVP